LLQGIEDKFSLGIAGEDLGKVVYRLSDPGQYAGRRVMVIGGGNSALEAAIALAEVPDTVVTLVHRGTAFGRARAENRDAVETLDRMGAITVLRSAKALAIAPGHVTIADDAGRREIANDAVIVCAGGTMPREWLAHIGVAVETHHGQPADPGLGTITAGPPL
jgi:thioredoxin reductase